MPNFQKVKRVLWIILFLNLGVAVLKIMVGSLIKSMSMTADGFHSLTDGTSNIVGLIGVHFAAQPEDDDHPYGHKKFETIAGLFIAGMLFFISMNVIVGALSRLMQPIEPTVSLESLLVLLITLVINIFVSRYEKQQGEKYHSDILIADSMHTRSDIFISLGVLVTLIGVKLGLPAIIDSIASLVVSVFILRAAYQIFQDTTGILTDKAVIDETKLKEIALRFPQVKDVHKIRSRGRLDDIHIDLHVMIKPEMSIEEAHQLAHELEAEAKKELYPSIQMIVHLEPYYNLSENRSK